MRKLRPARAEAAPAPAASVGFTAGTPDKLKEDIQICLRWERHSGGYQLEEHPPQTIAPVPGFARIESVSGGDDQPVIVELRRGAPAATILDSVSVPPPIWIVPKGPGIPFSIDNILQIPTLYERLAACEPTPDGALDFVDKFGLLHTRKRHPADEVCRTIDVVRSLVSARDRKDYATLLEWAANPINSTPWSYLLPSRRTAVPVAVHRSN